MNTLSTYAVVKHDASQHCSETGWHRRLWAALCLLACMLLPLAAGCSAAAQQAPADAAASYQKDIFAMDTVMTLTAYGPQAQTAVQTACEEIERLDKLFSTNNADSCVSQLNTAKQAQWPADGIAVLQTALQLYDDTDGAFNMALYPVVKAWGFTTEAYQIPEESQLQQLLQHIDGDAIEISSDQVRLTDAATEIDLGGIVKGYTSDQVMRILSQHGVTSAIVSLGGNVQTLGNKPDGSQWRVGIQDPDDPESVLCVVTTADKAVITSGPYQRFFTGEDGTRYHHIMDPSTGAPAQSGLESVTIVSDSGMLADGLSTALFVMGPEQALDYWQCHADTFDAVLITSGGEIIVTAGLADSFQCETDYYVFGEATA